MTLDYDFLCNIFLGLVPGLESVTIINASLVLVLDLAPHMNLPTLAADKFASRLVRLKPLSTTFLNYNPLAIKHVHFSLYSVLLPPPQGLWCSLLLTRATLQPGTFRLFQNLVLSVCALPGFKMRAKCLMLKSRLREKRFSFHFGLPFLSQYFILV